MNRNEILERIKTMVSEKLEKEVPEINNDDTLIGLGADSLDITEIAMIIEEEFSLEIDGDDAFEELGQIDLMSLAELIESKS